MKRTRKARRPASCDGKQKRTKQQAKSVARYWATERMARMTAYRCRFCHLDDGSHAWHIGNA